MRAPEQIYPQVTQCIGIDISPGMSSEISSCGLFRSGRFNAPGYLSGDIKTLRNSFFRNRDRKRSRSFSSTECSKDECHQDANNN